MKIKTTDIQEKRVFQKYYKFIKENNDKFGLMSVNEIQKGYVNFINNHIYDALSAIQAIKDWKGKKIIDIGSGAGIPGIPIYIEKIMDIDECILLESKLKKVQFIERVKKELTLEKVIAINMRAEELARRDEYREKLDIALMRAVGNIEESIELSLPFLRIGGKAIIYRGMVNGEEEEFSTIVANKLGGKLEKLVSYSIKGKKNKRTLMIFSKIEKTKEKYPRRPGIPRKRSRNKQSN